MLVRGTARRHAAALGALALLLAAGVGAGLTGIEIAHRTQHAYPDYLQRARVAPLVINPSLATEQSEDIIRSTPGVERVTSDALLFATADDGHPRSLRQAETGDPNEDWLQVRVSRDGRYATQDRPVVDEGRMLRSGEEAFLGRDAARALDVHVGDTLPLAFWPASADLPDADPNAVMSPLGTAKARVVGIGVFGDQVLPDELFPRLRVLVTADVAGKFDCVPHMPARDDPRPLDELAPEVFAAGCSTSYRYYSLHVGGGDAGAARVADAVGRRFAAERRNLPKAVREAGVGYEVIPSFSADAADRVADSLSPAGTALKTFGITAGGGTHGGGRGRVRSRRG